MNDVVDKFIQLIIIGFFTRRFGGKKEKLIIYKGRKQYEAKI
jgi:hypothetical protein